MTFLCFPTVLMRLYVVISHGYFQTSNNTITLGKTKLILGYTDNNSELEEPIRFLKEALLK